MQFDIYNNKSQLSTKSGSRSSKETKNSRRYRTHTDECLRDSDESEFGLYTDDPSHGFASTQERNDFLDAMAYMRDFNSGNRDPDFTSSISERPASEGIYGQDIEADDDDLDSLFDSQEDRDLWREIIGKTREGSSHGPENGVDKPGPNSQNEMEPSFDLKESSLTREYTRTGPGLVASDTQPLTVQPKLKVGRPGDRYEAD